MTMTREELKGKQTPGEVSTYQSVEWNEDTGGTIVLNANSWSAFAHIYQHCVGKKYITEGRANAALYAEAHNVANHTGMWPEDLVARVKELEEAMGDPGFWGRAAARNGQKAAELERRVKELEEALAMAPGVRSHNEQGVPIRYVGICTDQSGCGCKQSQEIAQIRAVLNKKTA